MVWVAQAPLLVACSGTTAETHQRPDLVTDRVGGVMRDVGRTGGSRSVFASMS